MMLSIWNANFKKVFIAFVGLPGFNEEISIPKGFVSVVFFDIAFQVVVSV